MRRLRISAISYLNTAPLMWDFEYGSAGSAFEITYTVPSRCADALAAGTADIGIIPVAAYATVPGLVILPGVAIATRRAVRSILLVSKFPVEKIRTIALDTSSRTSVALIKVLCARFWRSEPEFCSMPPVLDEMLQAHDAGLLIGDPALRVDRSHYITYDLAEEWHRFTSKPFVFAFWAVREAALQEADASLDLAQIFTASRDRGLHPENLAHIARHWSSRVGLSEDEVRTYLTQHIHHFLDDACLEGLELFYQYARVIGALPAAPPLRFLEVSPSRRHESFKHAHV